jgi:hypothetical protein
MSYWFTARQPFSFTTCAHSLAMICTGSAIQSYYLENKYGIAAPQTFLATAERISGENLNPLVEQWLE